MSSDALPETVVSDGGTGTSFWFYAATALVLAAILVLLIVHFHSGKMTHH